jgi:hypothetical protein
LTQQPRGDTEVRPYTVPSYFGVFAVLLEVKYWQHSVAVFTTV